MKGKAFGHPTVLVPAPGLKAAWLPRLIATSTGTNPCLRRGHGYWLTILFRWVRRKHLRKAVRSSQGRSADLKCAMFVRPFDIMRNREMLASGDTRRSSGRTKAAGEPCQVRMKC